MKKDNSVNSALDARPSNNETVKDKYQTPNLEHLIGVVAEQIDIKGGQALYTSLDTRYAYGQISLNKHTGKHCNSQTKGGKAIGTYTIQTVFLD